jgi:hypothetical protein
MAKSEDRNQWGDPADTEYRFQTYFTEPEHTQALEALRRMLRRAPKRDLPVLNKLVDELSKSTPELVE